MALTFKELQFKLDKLVDDVVNRSLTDKIGKKVVKTVKNRTRKGFGVKQNAGKAERLKPLRQPTKKKRRNLKKRGRLSGETTPTTSNLTESGQMLNNIGYRASDKEVVVAPKGRQQQKARQVSKDRPFMNLSKSEIKELADLIANEFINDIKKKGL